MWKSQNDKRLHKISRTSDYTRFFSSFYFSLLLLVETKNHSKCGSEMNGAADGVGKVTQGLYVACSGLCIPTTWKTRLDWTQQPRRSELHRASFPIVPQTTEMWRHKRWLSLSSSLPPFSHSLASLFLSNSLSVSLSLSHSSTGSIIHQRKI